MLEALKSVNYERLEQEERDKLKQLVEQYQFHLQQFQDFYSNINDFQQLVQATPLRPQDELFSAQVLDSTLQPSQYIAQRRGAAIGQVLAKTG
jgi:hypothetical protein